MGRNRSEHDTGHGPVTPAAHDDEIGERLRRAVDEQIGGLTEVDDRLDAQPVPAQRISPLLEDEPQRGTGRNYHPARRRCQASPVDQRLDDADQARAGPARPGSTLDELARHVSGWGAVDSDQDAHLRHLQNDWGGTAHPDDRAQPAQPPVLEGPC